MNNFILNVASAATASVALILVIWVLWVLVLYVIPSLVSKMMDFKMPTSVNKALKAKERAFNMSVLVGYSREIVGMLDDVKSGRESWWTFKAIEHKLKILLNLNESVRVIPKSALIDIQVFMCIASKYAIISSTDETEASKAFINEECNSCIERMYEIIRLGTGE